MKCHFFCVTPLLQRPWPVNISFSILLLKNVLTWTVRKHRRSSVLAIRKSLAVLLKRLSCKLHIFCWNRMDWEGTSAAAIAACNQTCFHPALHDYEETQMLVYWKSALAFSVLQLHCTFISIFDYAWEGWGEWRCDGFWLKYLAV